MFFIAGMPRCRTYWFSQYLSAHEGVTCHHEALNGPTTKQAFYDLMEAPGCVGNSDSGLFVTDFQQRWPDAPTVILLRDPDEVTQSLCKLLGVEVSPKMARHQFKAAMNLKGLPVWYQDIDARIEEIHAHLGITFDQKMYNKFKGKNLQIPEMKVCLDSYLLWDAYEGVA